MNFESALIQKLSGAVPVSQEQAEKLRFHFDHLQRWNRKMNLTSVSGFDEILERHYCESLFLAAYLPPGPLKIADIGSGAGFPGIPVAVYRLDCDVTLVESDQRKAVFLREVSRDLRNIRVIAERAEQIEARFDWLISRAVRAADLNKLVPKLADNVALLIGESDLSHYPSGTATPLPWGQQKVLLTFHVKHTP